jgi:hypothetical protein
VEVYCVGICQSEFTKKAKLQNEFGSKYNKP